MGISVSKSSSGNTVDIAQDVTDELAAINDDLDGKAEITTVVDQSIYITESLTSTWREGLIGALFAVLVIWLFLRSWRSTLIAGVSIPLSVIGALIILWSRGESLNMLTLGGLTIAIGRVIDDSIVVIENAYRHLQEGDDAHTAAYTATREVSGAITASTLTTVAVFLPLGMVHGLASEFFRPFALTVTFALLASLLCALTVVPVAVSWLLSKRQVGHREPDETTRLQRAYLPALKLALGHKAVTLILAVGDLPRLAARDAAAQDQPVRQLGPEHDGHHPADAGRHQPRRHRRSSQAGRGDPRRDRRHRDLPGHDRQHRQPVRRRWRHQRLVEPGDLLDHDRPRQGQERDHGVGPRRGRGLGDAGTITVNGEDQSMGSDNSQIQVRVSADDPAVLKQANKQRPGRRARPSTASPT